jgi:uncharacterized membrane-anchored protein
MFASKNSFEIVEEEEKSPSKSIDTIDNNTTETQDNAKFPIKTLLVSLGLFILGLILLIVGLVEEFIEDDYSRGMAMWIVGLVTFIPGFYYSFLFLKAYRAKTLSERIKILREIPEM